MTSNTYFDITVRGEKDIIKRVLFNENRVSSILDNPKEYEVTVDRCQIPTSSVPVYIFDPNNIVQCKLTCNSSSVTKDLIFISSTVTIPGEPVSNYVWSYQVFIEMCNLTLKTAYYELLLLEPTMSVTVPPYFILDNKTNLISLLNQSTCNSIVDGLKISFNQRFGNYFGDLNYKYNSVSNFFDVQFLLKMYNGVLNLIMVDGVQYYINQQAYTTLFLISSIKALLIKSSFCTSPEIEGTQNNVTDDVLMSFYFEPKILSQQIFQYFPDEYEWKNLTSNEPLTRVNIYAVFISDDFVEYPLYVTENDTFNVKLLFRKRLDNIFDNLKI